MHTTYVCIYICVHVYIYIYICIDKHKCAHMYTYCLCMNMVRDALDLIIEMINNAKNVKR